MSARTLHGALLARAAAQPDAPVFTFLDAQGELLEVQSAATLAARAAAVAGVLTAAAPELAGAPVIVCTDAGPLQPAALLGCWMAGATAVPVNPPMGPAAAAAAKALAATAAASGAVAVLAPEALVDAVTAALAPLGEGAPRVVVTRVDLGVTASGSQALDTIFNTCDSPGADGCGGDDTPPALILYTSGSTGDPKGAVITHAGFLANLRALMASPIGPAAAHTCCWLPHAHIAGLYHRALALMGSNHAVILPPSAFVQRPLRWLEVMARQRCAWSAAPNFAYGLLTQLVTDAELEALDLSRWRVLISGGEKVSSVTMDAFYRRFAVTGLRPESLHPYFGMTETLCSSVPQGEPALRVAVSREGLDRGRFRAPEGPQDRATLIGNGPPLGDTELLIVNPETRRPTPPGWIGELWTRGSSVTPGYHRAPELTRSQAQARLADGRGPYFRTGDMAALHGGQLFITGRLKEMLIVRGKNHFPADIEASVQRALGLSEQRCAAFTVMSDEGEALGLALELEPGAALAEALRATRRAVAHGHGLFVAQLYFLPLGALPRTASNKLARQRCQSLARGGDWAEYEAVRARREREQDGGLVGALRLEGLQGPGLRAALLPKVVEVLAEGEVGALEHSQLSQPLAELGMGSLEIARVASRLRALVGVEPPFAALFDGCTVRGLVERLATQVEGGRGAASGVAGWRERARSVAWAMPDLMPPRRSAGGDVLLTGATGYLGSYLLAELLRQGERPVRCLVRARDTDAALARVEAALREGPGWEEAWRPRVRALAGDLTQPRLGLSEAAWRAQIEEVDVIVHNAANVNFVAPYVALAPVNVDPLQAICELAVAGGALKTLHLVSTLAVFNATQRREQRVVRGIDWLLKPDFHYSGYAQTKWVAEACARAAGSRGVPLGIHRPGVITGHSRTGHVNTEDFLCRMIKGCVQLGCYPDSLVELDLVAVDEVAEGIAAAVLRPVQTTDTYHWSSHPNGMLLSEMMKVFVARGHRMRPEPLQAWLDRVRTDLPMDNALFPVHPFLLEVPPNSHETLLEHFDGLPLNVATVEADALRADAGLPKRAVDAALIDRMAAWLEAEGYLAAEVSA